MAVDVREQAEGVGEAPAVVEGQRLAGLPYPSGPGGWTVADLELLPDDGLRYELVDGTLLVSPAPSRRHQAALGELVAILRAACPPACQVLFAPLGWQPGDTRSFEPDALVVPRGSVDAPVADPLLLVEVASPSTAAIDRTVKFNAYAEGGVTQYWIVDPGVAGDGSDCAVEVYDLVDGAYVLQVRGVGTDEIAVTGPVLATLVPAELLR